MKQQMRFKHKQYIGIDPDSKNSGVAILSVYDVKDEKGNVAQIELFTADFHTAEGLIRLMESHVDDTVVAIEKCWATTANWHLPKVCSPNMAAKIGLNTGKCHMVGMLFEDFCKRNGFNYTLVDPLKKIWGKTRNEKISHNELMQVFRSMHIRYIGGVRTNQEERDAALIALTRQ